MAAIQTDYTGTIAKGYPGKVANGETSSRISRTVEDAAGIGFGKAAFRGANDHGCTATAAAGKFLGFVIADLSLVVGLTNTADVVAKNQTAGIMTGGAIDVPASAAVNDGDPVFIAANGNINSTNTGTATDGWVFDETIGAAGLVRIAKR